MTGVYREYLAVTVSLINMTQKTGQSEIPMTIDSENISEKCIKDDAAKLGILKFRKSFLLLCLSQMHTNSQKKKKKDTHKV